MPAPQLLERVKDGTLRKLRTYRIEKVGCRWVVARDNSDRPEKVFQSEEAAENYLFGPLPAIEGEM